MMKAGNSETPLLKRISDLFMTLPEELPKRTIVIQFATHKEPDEETQATAFATVISDALKHTSMEIPEKYQIAAKDVSIRKIT